MYYVLLWVLMINNRSKVQILWIFLSLLIEIRTNWVTVLFSLSTGLNFLLSAGHSPGSVALSPGGMALSPGTVPSLAVPYVLLPSSALSSYPAALLANAPVDSHAHPQGIGFNMPAVVSPAHFVVSPGAFAMTGASPSATPSAAEHPLVYGTAVPASPATAQRQHDILPLSDPHVSQRPSPHALLKLNTKHKNRHPYS